VPTLGIPTCEQRKNAAAALAQTNALEQRWESHSCRWEPIGFLNQKKKSMLNVKTCWFGFVCGATLLVSSAAANGADAKSYQVTGPVLEVTPTVITVQKGNDKWEIQRNSNTKVTGDLKTGAKVTIYYTMVASEVEVKTGKSGKATKSESK
jgi:hypothetical protein